MWGPRLLARYADVVSHARRRDSSGGGARASIALAAAGPPCPVDLLDRVADAAGIGRPGDTEPDRACQVRRATISGQSLRVADAFGATAPGLLVVATGPRGFHASAVTDAHGRILLRIPKTFTGTLRLVFGGPAYAKLIRTLRVR